MSSLAQPTMRCNCRRALCMVLSLIVALFSICLSPSAAKPGLSWYCTRAKDHIQPRADQALSFVESCGGRYIDHRHTDPNAVEKIAYLTFDVGYENGQVARVLDTLKAENVEGAFFILGHVVEACPDLVRRMADEGHLVCNHTFTHKNLVGSPPEALAEELGRLEKACLEQTGVTVAPYFRPPEGRFDRAMLETASKLGYTTVFWSFAYADWDNQNQPDPAAAQKKIMENIHNGAVLLLHPTSQTNATILGNVIRDMKAQGYRFGHLDELRGAIDTESRDACASACIDSVGREGE